MRADLLEAFRVLVLREGNLIILPSITLEVAEACSGIRSLFSLLTLRYSSRLLHGRCGLLACDLGLAYPFLDAVM